VDKQKRSRKHSDRRAPAHGEKSTPRRRLAFTPSQRPFLTEKGDILRNILFKIAIVAELGEIPIAQGIEYDDQTPHHSNGNTVQIVTHTEYYQQPLNSCNLSKEAEPHNVRNILARKPDGQQVHVWGDRTAQGALESVTYAAQKWAAPPHQTQYDFSRGSLQLQNWSQFYRSQPGHATLAKYAQAIASINGYEVCDIKLDADIVQTTDLKNSIQETVFKAKWGTRYNLPTALRPVQAVNLPIGAKEYRVYDGANWHQKSDIGHQEWFHQLGKSLQPQTSPEIRAAFQVYFKHIANKKAYSKIKTQKVGNRLQIEDDNTVAAYAATCSAGVIDLTKFQSPPQGQYRPQCQQQCSTESTSADPQAGCTTEEERLIYEGLIPFINLPTPPSSWGESEDDFASFESSKAEKSGKKRRKSAHSALSAKVTDKSQDGKIFQIGKSQIVGKTPHNAVSKSQGKTPERSPQNPSAKAVHIHTRPVHAHVAGKSAPGYITSDEDTSSDSD